MLAAAATAVAGDEISTTVIIAGLGDAEVK